MKMMDISATGELPELERLRVAAAIAQAMIPGSAIGPAADEQTVLHTERFISRTLPESLGAFRAAHRALSQAARAYTGRRFEELSADEADALIQRWAVHPILGKAVNLLGVLYRVTHFSQPELLQKHAPLPTVQNVEQPRWVSQTAAARDFDASEPLECDVVVIGTGAGGAVVGRHLADQGLAVVFVEEGEHLRRNDFPGTLTGTLSEVYKNTVSIGNAPIMIPQGRLVGGSTAVNGGSSFRPPRWVTDRWCEEYGSAEFSTDALEGYFDRTENILQVQKADTRYAGPLHNIFTRGASELGWHSDVIARNAPGCRGEGFCDFGCKTDARRSTNLAYLPTAFEKGAFMLYGLRAERVIHDGRRATGIEAVALERDRSVCLAENGKPKRVRIHARAVILAGGALNSPLFLAKQGIGNSSGQLGRNITLHPSGPVTGLFDEKIDSAKYIPQADYSFEFLKEGLLLLSAGSDYQTTAPLLGLLGRPLVKVLEQQNHLAGIGYLLAEEARGRIRLGPKGLPILTYNITKRDMRRIQRALVLCSELLFAAGAREVFPGLLKPVRLKSKADVEVLARSSLSPSDLIVTSYHPLGSCRMSQDPRQGVVDLNHECHDLKGLFVVDGSTVSGPLGVNPQITIMALATRAAERIGALLSAS